MRMKKLSFLMLSFVFAFLLMTSINVSAEEPSSCDAGTASLVDVTIHYLRWDEEYEYSEMVLYTWGAGTNGSNGDVALSDGPFGSTATFKINPCDADDKVGLIPHPASGWTYKDGIDTDSKDGIDNKFIDVTKIKDGTITNLTVYVFQGSNEVYQEENVNQANTGKLFVVYFRPAGDYASWDTWTWGAGTNGSKDSIPFSYNLGLDGDKDPNVFKVAVYNIASDADDEIGFIVRTPDWGAKDKDWTSKYTEDFTDTNGNKYIVQGNDAGNRLINVEDIKGSGHKVLFAIQGNAEFITDFEIFKAKAFKFEIEKVEFEKINSLSVKFNQTIAYDPEKGPDVSKFEIKDQDGNVLKINKMGYDSKSKSSAEFKFLVDEINVTKKYTISYVHNGKLGVETVSKEITIPDTEAPIIQIADNSKVINIKQGARKIEQPDVKAFDNGVIIRTIRAEGIVDTAKPGEYTITYIAEDDFGNVTTATLVVVVESNVMVYWPFALITVVVMAGIGAGIYFTRKK